MTQNTAIKCIRRFEAHKEAHPVRLPDNHKAVIEGRTKYPATRVVARPDRPDAPLGKPLKQGSNNRKIGDRITKGRWKGAWIYTLTLEERATCPRSCPMWNDCFGNKMHMSMRYQPGRELLYALEAQIVRLAYKHQDDGFAVRLHVLGDFFSIGYVVFWQRMLREHPELRIFGFTARDAYRERIGNAIQQMNEWFSDRCHIRFSGSDTEVVDDWMQASGLPCPAQSGKNADKRCCGNCTLCWATTHKISFLRH